MPLSEILKGNSDPSSTRQLKETTRQVLKQVDYAIQKKEMHYIDYYKCFNTYILPTNLTPPAVVVQSDKGKKIVAMTCNFKPLDGLATQTSRPSYSC